MALQLLITANYQKAGSLILVTVNGTYGWKNFQATYGYIDVTLTRLDRITSSGPVTVQTIIGSKIPVGIERNGTITQDGAETSPFRVSKRISSNSYLRAMIRVDVYNDKKLLASESVYVK